MSGDALRADHTLRFAYRRSTGGALARFFCGLRDREVWASRSAGGTVEVPPVDWDPATGQPTEELVSLGEEGTVQTWTWVPPEEGAPGGYALALIRIDGADTSLLHRVEVAREDQIATGLRVRIDWAAERAGSIRDIRAFVPAGAAAEPDAGAAAERDAGAPAESDAGAAPDVLTDLAVRYSFEPGHTLSGFLRGLAGRRIEGGRCPSCGGVYVPPHPQCPACRVGPLEPVAMGETGTVTALTVVHLPAMGIELEVPFVTAWIRLDGADVPFAHLLAEVDPDVAAVGMRVEAVWAADVDLGPTWESIRYFRPTASEAAR